MKTEPSQGSASRTAMLILVGVTTVAVVVQGTAALASTLAIDSDDGAMPVRSAPVSVLPNTEAHPPDVVERESSTATFDPTVAARWSRDEAAQARRRPTGVAVSVAIAPTDTTQEPVPAEPARPLTTVTVPGIPLAPPPAPDVLAPAVPARPQAPTEPAVTRCVITYTLDGVSADVAHRAGATLAAQAPVDLIPTSGAPDVHIRSYWPADNPTNGFGWTGDVHGQTSIYLKPILEQTPDFAVRMLVHELGHVLGLDHTAAGTPMDDMPQTDVFLPSQVQAMRLPC